jgi:hypothetical protein
VQIGDPINVGEFMAQNSDKTPQEQMNVMRELLTERMRSSIFYIENDENYDSTYEVCAAAVKTQVRKLYKTEPSLRKCRLDAHFKANNITVQQISQMREESPEDFAKLMQLGREAFDIRKSKRISINSISIKYPVLSRVLKHLYLILALPYCIPVSILTLPIKLLCGFIFTKLKDYAFRNSIRYLLNLILWPILMVIYSIIICIFVPFPWSLAAIVLLLPAPIVAHETWRLMRLLISDARLFLNKELRDKYRQMKAILFKK